MTEERLVYTELKLPKSKKQNRKSHVAKTRKGLPWQNIVAFLGILCLLLMLTLTVVGYLYFQRSLECQRKDMKDTKEENSTGHFCGFCKKKWSCCGENCYYVSKEKKTWIESNKSCDILDSSLIKFGDKDDQHIIEAQQPHCYWIGAYKMGIQDQWKWSNDGSELSKTLTIEQMSKPRVKCGYISSTTMKNDNCTKQYYYICKRKFSCIPNSINY